MWARLNKRGTHLYCPLEPCARRRLATVLAKDERRKKQIVVEQRRRNRLRCGVGGRPHRCATPSTSFSSFSAAWLGCLALTVASSVGRLVCRMNECSWCQPRPITRYTTLTQCLLLLLLQWCRRRGARQFASGCCRKKKKGRRQRHRAFLLMCLFTPASVGPPTERVAAS